MESSIFWDVTCSAATAVKEMRESTAVAFWGAIRYMSAAAMLVYRVVLTRNA
jgi:hypothetical protein